MSLSLCPLESSKMLRVEQRETEAAITGMWQNNCWEDRYSTAQRPDYGSHQERHSKTGVTDGAFPAYLVSCRTEKRRSQQNIISVWTKSFLLRERWLGAKMRPSRLRKAWKCAVFTLPVINLTRTHWWVVDITLDKTQEDRHGGVHCWHFHC